jgi:hypothetical protein
MRARRVGLALLILMFSGHATFTRGHRRFDGVTDNVAQNGIKVSAIFLSEPNYMTGVMPIVRGHGFVNYKTGNGKCYLEFGLADPKGFLFFRFSLSRGPGARPMGAASDPSATTDETAGFPRPKKRGPFQAVPVMARAITERLA